jgi:cytochrome c-type biogenesis protein CcmH
MIAFWLVAAALIAAALVLILPPLLGRSRREATVRAELNLAVHRDRVAELARQERDGELGREQAEEARLEIERELLRDRQGPQAPAVERRAPRWAAVVVALAVPASALLVYLELGSPGAISPSTPAAGGATVAQGVPGEHAMDDLIAGLVTRLQADPGNLRDWVMLGRSYNALERFGEAREAFAEAARLAPKDPEVLTRLAEATALANEGDLTGRPEALLREVLAIEPRFPSALWLAGLAASQREQLGEAIGHWEVLEQVVTTADEKAMVSQYLAEARRQLGLPAPAVQGAGAPTAVEASPSPAIADPASTSSVTVRVSLAPELRDRVAAGDTVFVFARPAEGARMPLAIVRHTVSELPFSVTLDDSMAMSAGTKISSVPRIVVGARVSKSGTAVPQSGDLEGLSEALSPAGAPSVEVRIDRQI